MSQKTGSPPTEQPSLRRSNEDKVVAGVCGGLGRYFNVDPLWFRLGFVVITLAGGAGVLFYLIAWIVTPQQRSGEALTARTNQDPNTVPIMGGVVLVGIGLILLANTYLPWFSDVMWPLALVGAGLGLLYLGVRR